MRPFSTAIDDIGPAFRPRRERVKTLEEILREKAPFKGSLMESSPKLAENFGFAMTRLRTIASESQVFLDKAYQCQLPLPTQTAVGLDVACLPYDEAFGAYVTRYDAAIRDVAQMFAACNRIGRTEWVDDSTVRFSYIAAREQMNLLTWEVHRTRHTHELVRARSRVLTERGVPLDRQARQLIAILPKSLMDDIRVIEGTQILDRQEAAGHDTGNTVLGDMLARGGQTAAILAGVGLATAAVLASGIGNLAASGLALAAADPCLTLGEYCLHGWV